MTNSGNITREADPSTAFWVAAITFSIFPNKSPTVLFICAMAIFMLISDKIVSLILRTNKYVSAYLA